MHANRIGVALGPTFRFWEADNINFDGGVCFQKCQPCLQ